MQREKMGEIRTRFRCPSCGNAMEEEKDAFVCKTCGTIRVVRKKTQEVQEQDFNVSKPVEKPKGKERSFGKIVPAFVAALAICFVLGSLFIRKGNGISTAEIANAKEEDFLEDKTSVLPEVTKPTPVPLLNKKEERKAEVSSNAVIGPRPTPVYNDEPILEDILVKWSFSEAEDTKGKKRVEGTNIWYDDYTELMELDDILECYEMIPEGVRERMESFNVPVYIIGNEDEDLKSKKGTEEAFASEVGLENGWKAKAKSYAPIAVYDQSNDWALLYIKDPGKIEYYSNAENFSPSAVIHEYGHMVDWYATPVRGRYRGYINGISGTSEWKQIYEQNKDALSAVDEIARENVYINEQEGFAEAFRLSVLMPDRMAEDFPDVYWFVSKSINKYYK